MPTRSILCTFGVLLVACAAADDGPADGPDPVDADGGTSDGSPMGGDGGGFPGGEFPAGTRLLLGSQAGYLLSLHFDRDTALVDDPQIAELGARIVMMALRPSTRDIYAIVQESGDPDLVVQRIRLEANGALTPMGTQPAPFGDVQSFSFDRSGSWVLIAAERSFRIARVGADGSFAEPTTLGGDCDARSLDASPMNDVLVAGCGWDDRMNVYPFSSESGVSDAGSEIQGGGVRPAGAVPVGDSLVTFGFAENSDAGRNRAALVDATSTSLRSPIVVRAPWLGDESRPTTTAFTSHPTLPIAYAMHGYSYQYGGHHLSVVSADGGTLEALQHITVHRDSFALGTSPDGRWLLVGSHYVDEMRSYRIDATGQVGEQIVSTLVDDPIFIGFL